MYHRDEEIYCKKIAIKLKRCGIKTNIKTGEISYIEKHNMSLKCSALYLLRHGETEGSVKKRFMGLNSANSKLTDDAKNTLNMTAKQIHKLQFDVILYSNIPRVKETAEIIKLYSMEDACFLEIPWMVGIDNTGWEGKTKDELQNIDGEDFYQREVLHNIFARSSKGTSWATVLDCCLKLVAYINTNYEGKRVLLISQGSIFTGLQIVLHLLKSPWEGYSASELFSLTMESKQLKYGKLQLVYEAMQNN